MRNIFLVLMFCFSFALYGQDCCVSYKAPAEEKVLSDIKNYIIERIMRFRLQTCPRLKQLCFYKCKSNLTYDKMPYNDIHFHDSEHYAALSTFPWNRLVPQKYLSFSLGEKDYNEPDTFFILPYVYCTPSITVTKYKVMHPELKSAYRKSKNSIHPYSYLYIVHRKGPLRFYKEEDLYKDMNKDKYKNFPDALDLSLCDELYPEEEYFVVYRKDTVSADAHNYVVGGMGDVIPDLSTTWNRPVYDSTGLGLLLAPVRSYMDLRLGRLGDISYAMGYRFVNRYSLSKTDLQFPLYDTLNKLDRVLYFTPPYTPPRLWPRAYYLSGEKENFKGNHPLQPHVHEFPIQASFLTNHPKLTGDRDTMNYYQVGYIIDTEVPICFENYYEKYVKLQVFRKLDPFEVKQIKALFMPKNHKPDPSLMNPDYDYARGLFVEYAENRDIK